MQGRNGPRHALVGFAAHWLLRASSHLVEALLSKVRASVLLACATGIACAMIVARGLSLGLQPSGRSDNPHLYERVLLGHGKTPDAGLERGLVVHASKSVLARYLELRDRDDPADSTYRRALHRPVMEMRRDLGHRNGLCQIASNRLNFIAINLNH